MKDELISQSDNSVDFLIVFLVDFLLVLLVDLIAEYLRSSLFAGVMYKI